MISGLSSINKNKIKRTSKMSKLKKLQEEINQLQSRIEKPTPSNQHEQRILAQQLSELFIKQEYLQRKEKQQLKKQKISDKTKEILEFKSENLLWKKSNKSLLHHVWEGHFNSRHLFSLTQKQTYYELTLIPQRTSLKNLDEAKLMAESILKTLQIPKKK